MLRNRILLVRRKVASSLKLLNRISHKINSVLEFQPDPKAKAIFHRLLVMVPFVFAVFLLTYIKNRATEHRINVEKVEWLDKIVEQYVGQTEYVLDASIHRDAHGVHKKYRTSKEKSRKRFMTIHRDMLTIHEIKSLKAYQIMLKNNLNSRRILQIIEKESKDLTNFEDRHCIPIKPDCPLQPPNLQGRLQIKQWISLDKSTKIKKLHNYPYRPHPGIWSPQHCESRHSVAVIIPYRNRKRQLHILLQHLPSILKKQQINYSIFLIEQVGNTTFNKGILMNAGFMTALSRPAHGVTYHCFIFHDADLLSEDDRNMYTCPELPRHMSIAVDELGYKLPYPELVGGVFAIRTDHFIKVNGYSNSYWGWGGEDDDMGFRVGKTLKWTMRPAAELGRFSTTPHVKQKPFLTLGMRNHLVKTSTNRYKTDGLNSLRFTLKGVVERYQFTHVYVDVGEPPTDYRRLIQSGRSKLLRTLTQQLLTFLRKWPVSNSRTHELKKHLPGQIPNVADLYELRQQPTIFHFAHQVFDEMPKEKDLKSKLISFL